MGKNKKNKKKPKNNTFDSFMCKANSEIYKDHFRRKHKIYKRRKRKRKKRKKRKKEKKEKKKKKKREKKKKRKN